MATNLPPVLRQRYFDSNANPLSGGKLYTYQAGTTTPQATYTDSAGTTPNANPVILDSNGEAAVWIDQTLSYKFVLKNSSDVTQWTTDNVIGIVSNNAVSTASIQDSAVTTIKLANDAVDNTKLKDDPTVDANRAVTTNHIRDAAVTPAKLSSRNIASVSAAGSTLADTNDIVVFTGSSSFTYSLHAVASAKIKPYYLKNSGTGQVTVDPNSTEQIEGLTTMILYPKDSILIFPNATAWLAL